LWIYIHDPLIHIKHMRTLYLLLILSLFCNSNISAQQLDMEKIKGIVPRNIGPAGMSGRVTSIDVVLSDPSTIYVGTASGGLWKSESGGISWKPIFDKVNVQSIGAVKVQQNNPDVIWVGTGEGNPRNSLNSGYGLYKSIDGGKNWKLMGLEKTRNIHRIVIHRDNPDIVYVGAIGSPWGKHNERGLYRTMDGGTTWEQILFTNNSSGVADLIADPVNPNKLFAAMWEHLRKPWTFNSGGPGSGLYVTYDGGETWEKRTEEDGLPKGDLGRIGLAIAPSNTKRVYALIESKKNALYRSDDGGFTWEMINNKGEIGNRPFYYSDIYVDPENENRLYSLFSLVNYSEDGGKSFSTLLPYSGVHPDHHAWWIHPTNPDFMINGNDGGLNITYDRGENWRFVENLPLAQFYHINVDNEIPYNVYGGMQDNGSWAGPAYVWKSGGIRNNYWQEISFGDGFDVVPDPDDSRYGYTMSQQGYLSRYDRLTGFNKYIRPTHPDPDVRLRFNWNSAIAQDPFDNNVVYYGSQFVHKSTTKGDTWEIISPDLTTNNPEKQKQHESGGLTMDATGAENNTSILSIEPSPLEKGVIWVGTDDGYVQLTRDGGNTWTNVTTKIGGMPAEGWVAQIRASLHNAGEAFVIVNNYRNNDYKPYAFRTTDYGQTWNQIAKAPMVDSYTLSIVQDPVEPNLLFLGTDFGLYISIDNARTWTKWTHEYPAVNTIDLVIHPREHDLVIGTFGRAAWVIDDIRPLRELAEKGTGILNQSLHIFKETPTAYLNLNQQPAGTRFAAEAIYKGDNRRSGAMITYVLNKPDSEKKQQSEQDEKAKKRKSKKKKDNATVTAESMEDSTATVNYDSLHVEIKDASGLMVRNLSYKLDAEDDMGVRRYYWNLRSNGVNRPGRRIPKENTNLPSGFYVLPGKYTVIMTYGNQVDSTEVEVKFDPRVDVSEEILAARIEKYDEIYRYIDLAARASTKLLEALEITSEYDKLLKSMDDEEFSNLKETQKAVKDSLNSMLDELVGKEDDRQGITRNPVPRPYSYYYSASSYVSGTLDMPSTVVDRLIEQGNSKLLPLIDQINSYFREDWPRYRSEMENAPLSPFKDWEDLEIRE